MKIFVQGVVARPDGTLVAAAVDVDVDGVVVVAAAAVAVKLMVVTGMAYGRSGLTTASSTGKQAAPYADVVRD